MSKKYTYSEIFYSIQGEGKYTGVPTAWVRFFTCNLNCDGFGQKDPTDRSTYILPYKDFDPKSVNRVEDLPVWKYGCDSSYSWAAKFKHLQHSKTAEEICDAVRQLMMNETNPKGLFLHPHSKQSQHMCFTGGEPLLRNSQLAVVDIMKTFRNQPFSDMPESITFETNGTQPLTPEFIEHFSNRGLYRGEIFWSVSPKLLNVSGEPAIRAIKPTVVEGYKTISNSGQLKFVMGMEERQWDELDRVIEQFRDHGIQWPVYIMPVGATEEAQNGEEGYASAGQVAEKAFRRGYNVSARVHVYLWSNIIGV